MNSNLVMEPAPAASVAPSASQPSLGHRIFVALGSPYVPPLFITLILLVGNLSFGILESYRKTLLAIVTSVVAEMILGRLYLRKWPHPASSYISGISVGILLRSPAFWPFAVCSLLSITSKYTLRFRNRHIWNPSNFGICAMLFLASQSVASLSIQWGNNFGALIAIWALGSVILWRARRFHISLTYVLSFVAFSFVRSAITGDPWQAEISPITGPMYQLFIFFMITDPKTTVRSRTGQCVVAFGVAAMEMILRLNSCVFAPLYALFWVGPAALFIEMGLDARRLRRASATASLAPEALRS